MNKLLILCLYFFCINQVFAASSDPRLGRISSYLEDNFFSDNPTWILKAVNKAKLKNKNVRAEFTLQVVYTLYRIAETTIPDEQSYETLPEVTIEDLLVLGEEKSLTEEDLVLAASILSHPKNALTADAAIAAVIIMGKINELKH